MLARFDETPRRPRPRPDAEVRAIAVTDTIEGDGPILRREDIAVVDYVAYAYQTGRLVASTWTGPRPGEITVNDSLQIQGLGALLGMRRGGRRTIVMPVKLGIPPGTGAPAYAVGVPLYWVVDLRGIKRPISPQPRTAPTEPAPPTGLPFSTG